MTHLNAIPYKATTIQLSDVVKVRPSFHRSVNIEADIGSIGLRQSFLLNKVSHQHASTVLRDIASPEGSKAWAVTGPFGSGKSSFAAFVADILSQPKEVAPEYQALRLENGLNNERFRVVPIVGHRSSIKTHLAQALAPDSTAEFDLNASLNTALSDAKSKGYSGIFVLFDEFNRALEYEAHHPRESDLAVIQSLAERASRSTGDILFMTIQHMSFADYASSGFTQASADEWRKIQGRFRDISFFLPHSQSLELMGKALEVSVSPNDPRRERHNVVIGDLLDTGVLQRIAPKHSLESTWPIHPIAAIIATELFRGKLAQNERSIFAFLGSREPNGFQDFLTRAPLTGSPKLFDLALLFDYVVETIGAAAFIGADGREWAQVEYHIEKVSQSLTPLHENLVKATFLLNRYGSPVGLHATEAHLTLALGDGHSISVEAAIEDLLKERVLRRRRYRGDLSLASGSDYDFDAELERARLEVSAVRVSDRLISMPSAQLRRAARRHYVRTGNLRTYSIHITDQPEDDSARAADTTAVDLVLHFIVPETQEESARLIANISQFSTDSRGTPRIYAVVRDPESIRGITIDTAAATWLLDKDEELDSDDVARSEVKSFRDDADAKALSIVGPLFGWGGYRLDPKLCYWSMAGLAEQPQSAADIHRLIDDVLTSTYSLAPAFHNELINRNVPSSAAARARRELITAMVTRESEKRLAIKRHPPEAAIYETLLLKEGFHQLAESGVWHITRPTNTWGDIWDAITNLVESDATGHVPLTSVAEMLNDPPFGLKLGPIPIVIAAYLIGRQNAISLFENGTYVAELRPEVFERMLRSFNGFSVRSLPTDSIQTEALDVVRRHLASSDELEPAHDSRAALIATVRSVLRVVTSLPQFSRRTREFLDHAGAAQVRETTLRSQDPQQLLLHELPQVLGFKEIQTPETQEAYARELRSALVSLDRAYQRMLDHIGSRTKEIIQFGEPDPKNEVLFDRMMPLHTKRQRGALGQLIAALVMTGGDWRENVGRAVLEGKPTQQWDDRDVHTFEVRIHQLGTILLDLEALSNTQREHASAGTVALVSVLGRSGNIEQVRRPITVDALEQETVSEAAQQMLSMLRSQGLSESGTYAALAEAMVLMKQQSERS